MELLLTLLSPLTIALSLVTIVVGSSIVLAIYFTNLYIKKKYEEIDMTMTSIF